MPPRPHGLPAQGLPVLVAEDDTAIRRVVARVLETEGYRVIEVGDGLHALTVLLREPVALAIIDYTMPSMSGESVIGIARKELGLGAPPMLLFTALESELERFAEMGAVGVLPKPFRIGEFVAIVREHVRAPHSGVHPILEDAETMPPAALPATKRRVA